MERRWEGNRTKNCRKEHKLTTQKGTTETGDVLHSLWPPAGPGGFQLRLGAGTTQDTGDPQGDISTPPPSPIPYEAWAEGI